MPQIRQRHRTYTKEYLLETSITAEEIGVHPLGWVACALEMLEEASRLAPLNSAGVYPMVVALRLCKGDASWREAARTSPSKLDMEVAVAALSTFERVLLETDGMSRHLKSLAVTQLRKWMLNVGMAYGNERLSRFHLHFQPSLLREKSEGRGLISDLVDDFPPLGATPHAGPSELKARTTQRINHTLGKLRQACIAELDEVADDARAMELALALRPDPQLVNDLRKITEGTRVWNQARDNPWVAAIDPLTLLAAYRELMDQGRHEVARQRESANPSERFVARPLQICAVRGRELSGELVKRFGLEPAGLLNIHVAMFNVLHGGFSAAVSCLLLIQLETGWNVGSCLSLDESCLLADGHGLEIQGFKSKTGDYTPSVFIDPAQHEVLRAISLLRTRLADLKALGWVPDDCQEFWLRPRSPGVYPKAWIAWSFALQRFVAKHNLPPFSFEMVRVVFH